MNNRPRILLAIAGLLGGCQLSYVDIGKAVDKAGSGTGGPTTDGMGGAGGLAGGGGAGGTTTTTGTGGAPSLCSAGKTQPCYDGPAGTAGQGICAQGMQTCASDGLSWGPCLGEVLPQVENCATPIDEDCNGMAPACTGGVLAAGRFGGAFSQFGRAITSDAAGNVILLGEEGAPGGTIDLGGGVLGGPGIVVAKLDPDLGHVWSRSFIDPIAAVARSVAVGASGTIAITGSFGGSIDFGTGQLHSGGGADVFVTKLDATGATAWSRSFGGLGDGFAGGIAIDGADNIVGVGQFSDSMDVAGDTLVSMGVQDVYAVKLDPSGSPAWSSRFGSAGHLARALGVAVDGAGDVVIVGFFSGTIDFGGGVLVSAGGTDGFVVKLDPKGAHLWSKSFGDAADQQATSVAVDAAGNVVVTGTFAGSVDLGGGALASAGGDDIFLAKLSPGGAHLWSKRFGDGSDQEATSLAVDVAGNVLLAGGIDGLVDFGGGQLAGFGAQDVFIAKFDASGGYIWAKRFGDAQDHQLAFGVAADPSANVLVTGEFLGTIDFGAGPVTSAGAWDLFLAKFAP